MSISLYGKGLNLSQNANTMPRSSKRTFGLTIDDQDATNREPFFAVKVLIDPSLGFQQQYVDPNQDDYVDPNQVNYVSPEAAAVPVLCIDSGTVDPITKNPIINPVFVAYSGEEIWVAGVGIVSSGEDAYGMGWITDSNILQVIAFGGQLTQNN